MTLEKCYESFSGDYAGTVSRLGSPDFLKRFLSRFLADPNMESLKKALGEKDAETAFRSAHTLKGLALNFGFTDLAKKSSAMTEVLRGRTEEGLTEAVGSLSDLEAAYEAVCSAIKQAE